MRFHMLNREKLDENATVLSECCGNTVGFASRCYRCDQVAREMLEEVPGPQSTGGRFSGGCRS